MAPEAIHGSVCHWDPAPKIRTMTHVYEAKANVNDIEGTGLPRQWGCNIQLLEFKVGGDRAGKGRLVVLFRERQREDGTNRGNIGL